MKLESLREKASYAMGVVTWEEMKHKGFAKLELESFIAGIQDAMKNESVLAESEIWGVVEQYKDQEEQATLQEAMAPGRKYLEENARRAEVTVLESGLQYEVLEEGSGPIPKAEDTVKTHYHGTLINGEVFDSSVVRNEPAVFPLNRVIQGWQEALQLMRVGSKWKLYIPHELAYGKREIGNGGPYATLIFEVELLELHSRYGY